MIENDYMGQKPWGFLGDNIGYIIIEETADIHKNIDLVIAKEWVKNNL